MEISFSDRKANTSWNKKGVTVFSSGAFSLEGNRRMEKSREISTSLRQRSFYVNMKRKNNTY